MTGALLAEVSGIAIGVAGDAGGRAYAQTDGISLAMTLILIFAEAIGLYGLIVAATVAYIDTATSDLVIVQSAVQA